MPSSLRASLLVTTLVAAGCSAPVVDDVADANGGMTEALVVVERVAAVDGATQSHVSAKFMRLSTSADIDLAEQVVGSRLDLPNLDECRPVASGSLPSHVQTASLASLGPIELVDVGDVTVKAGSSNMALAARAFPDVGEFLSGVVYTSRDASRDLPAAALYTLEGSGSAAVERFSFEAEAPEVPEDVRVGDVALAEGVVLEEGQNATLRWRAPAPNRRDESAATPRDVVVVDVGAENGALVRCAFQDDGAATIPASVLRSATFGDLRLPIAATLAVHRIRQRSFSAPGLDAGELRFDLSVLGRITLTSAPPQ